MCPIPLSRTRAFVSLFISRSHFIPLYLSHTLSLTLSLFISRSLSLSRARALSHTHTCQRHGRVLHPGPHRHGVPRPRPLRLPPLLPLPLTRPARPGPARPGPELYGWTIGPGRAGPGRAGPNTALFGRDGALIGPARPRLAAGPNCGLSGGGAAVRVGPEGGPGGAGAARTAPQL